jgi:hypothetical protein
MGYTFHMTRAANWFDSENFPIGRDEWEQLADGASELVLDGHVRWRDIGPQPIYGLPGESVGFSWRHGRVVIEGYFSDRAEEVANRLAALLGARVQGDDEDQFSPCAATHSTSRDQCSALA